MLYRYLRISVNIFSKDFFFLLLHVLFDRDPQMEEEVNHYTTTKSSFYFLEVEKVLKEFLFL